MSLRASERRNFERRFDTVPLFAWQILKEVLYEEVQEANGYSSDF